MQEIAEECAGKVEWMKWVSRSGEGRLVSPDLEHVAVWWTEGNAAKRELEAVQEMMGRRLLRTSISER